MAGEPTVPLIGNLVTDPEIKFNDSGRAWMRCRMAVNAREKKGDQWEDKDAMYVNISAWGTLAENVANSLTKGQRVIVLGSLWAREFTRDDGTKGTSIDMKAEAMGPELRFATATVSKAENLSNNQNRGQGQVRRSQGNPATDDPWASTPSQPPQYDDAPPF